MAAETFAALVKSVQSTRDGCSVNQIAKDADMPAHFLTYYMKPGTVVRQLPDESRIVDLARALDVTADEVRQAFARDVGLVDTADDIDPQTAELVRLFEHLDPVYRDTGLAMLRSLGHLQRQVRENAP